MPLGLTTGTDPDWLSISTLATERGVTRQAISDRVKKLRDSHQLPTRGAGRGLRVHAPTFREIVATTADPAQAARIRHLAPGRIDPEPPRETPKEQPAEPQPSTAQQSKNNYDDAAARERHARAELAEMEAAKRRGELVAVAEFEAAAVAVGTKLAQSINALRSRVTPFYAAAQQGEDALHTAVNLEVDAMLRTIAKDMAQLAATTTRRD